MIFIEMGISYNMMDDEIDMYNNMFDQITFIVLNTDQLN